VAIPAIGHLTPLLRQARVQAQVSAQPDAIKGTLAMVRWAHSLWPTMYDALRAATAADRPDVLVVDLVSVAGMDAAEVGGIPYLVNNADLLPVISVRLLPPAPGVPLLFSGRSIHSRRPWSGFLDPLIAQAGAAFLELTLGRELNALRRTRGLPPQPITRRPACAPIMTDSAFGLEYPAPCRPGCTW
jgi:UDP:flavonoid glycosyltransferase YjiC (YdhE family)